LNRCGETPSLPSQEGVYYDPGIVVEKVVDGDTVITPLGTIRYIGVDAPEKNACGGEEATKKNQELVEGKKVVLEKDIEDKDPYNRLLRYLYLPDGKMVNEILIREGFAKAMAVPPNTRYYSRFKKAEELAREEKKGIWKNCSSF